MAKVIEVLWYPFRAAIIKKLGEYRHYLIDYIVGLLVKIVFFVAMLVAYPEPELLDNLARVGGFILWYLAAHVLAKMSNVFIEEASLGTLLQVLSARTPLLLYLVVHAIAEVVMSTIWIGAFVVLAGLLTPVWTAVGQLSLWQVGTALGVMILALVAVMGMGLVLFGLSIRFKRVGSISEVLSFWMLFFSGFYIPSSDLPRAIVVISSASPLWWAFEILSRLLHEGPLGLTVVGLAVNTTVWISAGMILTNSFLRQAKARGILTTY